jgi:fucose permease
MRTFLEKDLAVGPRSSSLILATFWVMMMLGRLIASQVLKKVRGPQLVLGASVGAIAGLLLIALASNVLMATAGAVICGLSYAPVFPTTAGTASTYFSRMFGTVFGMLMALALLSGAMVPPAIGYVAQHQSVRAGFWILVGIAVLLFLTQLIFNRYERKKLLTAGPA